MMYLTLTDGQRCELQSLRRSAPTARVRDRVEMAFLSDAGGSPPRIAAHLACHAVTVRAVLKDFTARGTAAMTPGRTGPPPDLEQHARVAAALGELLARERLWTAGQLAEELRGRGFEFDARQARRYLAACGAKWKRTSFSLDHKQDPERVEAAKADLERLEKKAKAAAGRSTCSTSTSAASPRPCRRPTRGRPRAAARSSPTRTRAAGAST